MLLQLNVTAIVSVAGRDYLTSVEMNTGSIFFSKQACRSLLKKS